MKFKNEIFFNKQFMETVARVNTFEDWEPKGAYWFNRLVKKLRLAQDDFNDVRNKLIEKYGDEPDDDENIKVAEVHFPSFKAEIEEVMEEEFEITGIKPIKFPKSLKLSPEEMGMIDGVVDMSDFLEDDD